MKDISETPEFIGKFCQCGLSGVLGAGIRVPPVLSQGSYIYEVEYISLSIFLVCVVPVCYLL